MDKLVLERTQPVQGNPVDVRVSWNGEMVGELTFTFQGWLKFKKLLEKGLEMDAREDHALNMKLSVVGMGVVAKGESYPQGKTQPYRGGISNLAEDEEDKQDLRAIAAAEAGSMPATNPPPTPEDNEGTVTEGLIRSLRRENADG